MALTKPKPPAAEDGEERELIKWGEEFKRLADARSLAVFRIKEKREPCPEQDFGNGQVWVVVTDVLFASGPRKGELHQDVWAIGKGITNTLVRSDVGDDVATRLDLAKRGTTPYPQANEPSDVEFEAIEKVYRDGAGFNAANGKAPAYAGGQAADASDAPF